MEHAPIRKEAKPKARVIKNVPTLEEEQEHSVKQGPTGYLSLQDREDQSEKGKSAALVSKHSQ